MIDQIANHVRSKVDSAQTKDQIQVAFGLVDGLVKCIQLLQHKGEIDVQTARNGNFQSVVSDARISFDGDAVILMVSGSEFDVPDPHNRISLYRHTGDWGQQPPYDWSGSVFPEQHQPLVDPGQTDLPNNAEPID